LEEKGIERNNNSSLFVKGNNKFIIIFTISVIVIGSIGAIFWYYTNVENVEKAQLVVEMGIVQIRHAGESWQTAKNGTLLIQTDSIRTRNNSAASVILFESSIIRLDNNTEITLEEIINIAKQTQIKIKQVSGRTWNTLLKISGIDSYEVQTPNTIASVRGTSFFVEVLENGSTAVGVVHGNVTITRILNNESIDTYELKEDELIYIDPLRMQEPLNSQPLTLEDWIVQNILKDEEFINVVKTDLWVRIEPYIDELKEKFGITEEELEALLEGYLRGYYDLPPETPDWVRDIIKIN